MNETRAVGDGEISLLACQRVMRADDARTLTKDGDRVIALLEKHGPMNATKLRAMTRIRDKLYMRRVLLDLQRRKLVSVRWAPVPSGERRGKDRMKKREFYLI